MPKPELEEAKRLGLLIRALDKLCTEHKMMWSIEYYERGYEVMVNNARVADEYYATLHEALQSALKILCNEIDIGVVVRMTGEIEVEKHDK